MKRIKTLLGFFLVTILLTGIADLIMLATNYIPILNRMETSLFDWDIPDIIYSSDKFKEVKIKNEKITLVNWEFVDRDTIALVIEELKRNNPKVLGIDAVFLDRKDSLKDEKLRISIQGVNTVMPMDLSQWNEKEGKFQGFRKSIMESPETSNAFSSFYSYDPMKEIYGSSDDGLVRTFSPREKVKDDTIYCFAFEIVKRYNKNIFKNYLNKFELSDNEQLRYWGDSSLFNSISYRSILNKNYSRNDIEGKIVILTFLGYSQYDWRNLEGKFITPLNNRIVGRSNPDTYSGVIHANIILSMLNGTHIKRASWWTTVLIQFFITLLFIMLLDSIRAKRFEKIGLYSRVTAYTIVGLLVGLSLLLYFILNYSIDLRLSIFYVLALPEIYLIYIHKIIPFVNKLKIKKR